MARVPTVQQKAVLDYLNDGPRTARQVADHFAAEWAAGRISTAVPRTYDRAQSVLRALENHQWARRIVQPGRKGMAYQVTEAGDRIRLAA